MKKILFICEEIPTVNTNGYSTYNHAFLSSLVANDDYDVHLLVVGNRFTRLIFRVSDITGLAHVSTYVPQAANLVRDIYLIGALGFLKYIYKKMVNRNLFFLPKLKQFRKNNGSVMIGRWLTDVEKSNIDKIISRVSPDVIFADTLFRTPNVSALPKECLKVLIGHDVFYQRCQSLIMNGQVPEPNVTEDVEAKLVTQYDCIVAITELDASVYKRISPLNNIITLSSPIIVSRNIPARRNTQHILYLGSQAHHNVDGLLWFINEIWPLVRKINQSLVLDVVGSIANSINVTVDGIVFHGRLDDFTHLAADAMFAINPVRAGSGMKIKMLDYFAKGLGCLTTSVGAAGFPETQDSPILMADSPHEFANSIIQLSGNINQMNSLSDKAIAYADLFSKDKFKSVLYACLDTL